MRLWTKIILYFFITIILLVTGMVLFTQTQLFKDWIKDKIVNEANKNLNANLSIGKIHGNLLTRFQISDVLLINDQTKSIHIRRNQSTLPDTILSLSELTIDFSPARMLKKEIYIKLIELDSIHFRLWQLADSSWNFEHLLISKPDIGVKSPEVTHPMKWQVDLNDMLLKNGRIDLFPLNESPIIPHRINDINTQASLTYDQNEIKADLDNLRLKSQQPDFVLKKLSFNLSLEKNKLNIRQLLLQSPGSRIMGEATAAFSAPARYQASISAAPLDFSEVQNFIPDFPIRIQSDLKLTASLEYDSLIFNIDVIHQNQILKCNGKIDSLSHHPNFQFAVAFDQVNLENWLTLPDLSAFLNGQLEAKGSGTNLQDANLNLVGKFKKGEIFQRSFEQIDITANYLKGNLNSDIQAVGNFGQFQLTGKVKDISNNQSYKLDGKFNHIDLSHLMLDDSLSTDLNLALQARGTNFLPEKMRSTVTLNVSPTDFMGTKIDTLISIIKIKESNFLVDTLDVESHLAQLHLSGNLDLKDENHIHFTGHLKDLGDIRSILHADSLKALGNIAGYLHGKLDSLLCEANFDLEKFLYNTITSQSVQGNLSLSYISDSLNAKSSSKIKQLAISSFTFDSLDVKTNIANKLLDFSINVAQSDSIRGQIDATLLADSLMQLTIPRIDLNLKNHLWTGGTDSMQVLFKQDDYEFQNIRLSSDDQFIQLGGKFSLLGDENLRVEVSNTDVSSLMELIESPLNIQGKIRLFMEMKGTADSPIVSGIVSIENAKVNRYAFEGASLNVSYESQLLMFLINLNHDITNSLVSIGSVPINLSLTNNQRILDYNKPINIDIKSDGLDFSVLQAFSEQVRNVKGKILIDLSLENTLNDPHPSGYLRLANGELRIPEFGVNYKDIQMSFIVDTSSFEIDKFQVQSDRGILTAAGNIDFSRSGFGGVIKTTDINLTANNFLAINNRNYEVIIGGDVNLTGDPAAPKFGGSIRVMRSRFYIPALIQAAPQTLNEIQPILIGALKDSTKLRVVQPTKTEAASKYLKNLKGSIKVDIPRNTWLRSPEMNVEISGNLNLVKQSEAFELFGTIQIIRGFYDLYGKRFVIQKGSFSFDGGTEYNPEIDLLANHTLRTADRQKKTLSLEVTGKALAPKLKFTLDDNDISEGDAVSYLLLGRSLEELTHGQRSQLNQQAGFNPGSQAGSIMVGLVAGQLSKTIGRTLNLDVIEVKGEENWQQATFIIGKYLTNDLFLSYQKEFGFRQTNQLQPDEITLEYEINRRIFLQLTKGSETTTGIDFILKFEK